MNGFELQLEGFLKALQETQEYIEYQSALKKIMQDKPLYDKINEFRRKNFELQISGAMDIFEKSDALRKEYQTVLLDPKAADFIYCEQRICRLARRIQDKISDCLKLDVEDIFH